MLGYVDFAVINTEFSKQSPTLTAFEAFMMECIMNIEIKLVYQKCHFDFPPMPLCGA